MDPIPSSSKRKQLDDDEDLGSDTQNDEYDDDSDDDNVRGDYFVLDKVLKVNQKVGKESDQHDIKITPFNLKEELEEGEFDCNGDYIPKKSVDEEDEEKDNWAESIDWEAVQEKERAGQLRARVNVPQVESPSPTPKDKVSCYKEMLRIMKPDETIQRAIKRLGDSVPKRRPTKQKSSKAAEGASLDPNVIAETKRRLDRLIELAHQIVEDGDIDIYQKSYEDLEEAINA